MQADIQAFLAERGCELIGWLDLSSLPAQQRGPWPRAVIFGKALSRGFLRQIYQELPTARDEYLELECEVEAWADALAGALQDRGYRALSQSEAANLQRGQEERGYIDPAIVTGPSLIPQKTLARLGGLGYIGKNNLLITPQYGAAVVLCSVLTDAPFATPALGEAANRCGDCLICREACPSGALHGKPWSATAGRENLLDIAKCACPLRCMVYCPQTLAYAFAR